MIKEFAEKYNEIVNKMTANKNIIREEKKRWEEEKVIGINNAELEQDVHYIAISILEELTTNKKFRLGKDRTNSGKMLFVENNMVKYRDFNHKIKHEIRWLKETLPYEKENSFEIMPQKFIDMCDKIKIIKKNYEEEIKNTFFSKDDNTYRIRQKVYQTIHNKEVNIPVQCKKERYGELLLEEREVSKIELLANIANYYDDHLNLSFNVYYKLKNLFANKYTFEKIDYGEFPTLENEELFSEMMKAFDSAKNYCDSWLKKRFLVRQKIDSVIEEHGYLTTLAVSRI